jgi:hypothetical protein
VKARMTSPDGHTGADSTAGLGSLAVAGPLDRMVRPLAVAWLYADGRPCALSFAGQDEARMHEMASSLGLIRRELFAHQPPATRTPVAGSGLDFRTMNCLLSEGFEYVEDAQAKIDRELLNIPNFGRASLARLRAWMPSGA